MAANMNYPFPHSPFRNPPMPTGPDPRQLPVGPEDRIMPVGPDPRDQITAPDERMGPKRPLRGPRGPKAPFPTQNVPAPPGTQPVAPPTGTAPVAPPGGVQPVAPPSTTAPGFTERPPGDFATPGVGPVNQYGGQQIAGAGPLDADYGSVQSFADAAYEQARRYLDPQQESENRRLEQTLINRGVDPFSEQGQLMLEQMKRSQADANNAAAFQAMGFGQGIQDQMVRQELAKSQLAGDMQKALWGQETARSAQELQKYLGDQSTGLGYAGLENQRGIAEMANSLQRYLGDQDFALGQAGLEQQQYATDLAHQLGLSGQDLQRYLGDQDFALGQAGLDQQRYATDLAHALGLSGQDLQRYGMDQDFALGQSGQDLQRYLGEMQNTLGMNQLDTQRYLGELQNQLGMAGMDLERYGLDLNQALQLGQQDLSRYGIDTDAALTQAGLDNQRYLAELQNALGLGQLDLARQGQDFNQMLGLEGLDFRDQQYADSRSDYQDQLLLSMLGMSPTPGGAMADPSGAYGASLGSAASNQGLLGPLSQLAGTIGSIFPFSDRRLKKNIRPLGVINGTRWYSYDYLWDEDGTGRVGVMAQEVPHAAVEHPSGFLMVDYGRV